MFRLKSSNSDCRSDTRERLPEIGLYGAPAALLWPSVSAGRPSPQLSSCCRTEKRTLLKGDINCLGAIAGRSLAELRCTFAAALQMICRVLAAEPPFGG